MNVTGMVTANALDFAVGGYTMTGSFIYLDGMAKVTAHAGVTRFENELAGGTLTFAGPGEIELASGTYDNFSYTLTDGVTVTIATAPPNGDWFAPHQTLNNGTLRSNVDVTMSGIFEVQGVGGTISAATGKAVDLISIINLGNGATLRFGSATDNGTVTIASGAIASIDLGSHFEVAGGTLVVQSFAVAFNLGNVASTTVASGATLDLAAVSSNATLRNLQGGGTVKIGPFSTVTEPGVSLTIDDSLTTEFSGTIAGPGGILLARSGIGPNTGTAGTLILSGDNTFADVTTIAIGAALQLGNGGASGSVAGNIVNGGTLTFNRSDDYTYVGIISNNGFQTGTLVQNGSGRLVLSGANTHTGGTIVNAGVLELASGGTFGGSTVPITVNAGSLNLGGTTQTTGAFTMAGGTVENGTLDSSSYEVSGGSVRAVLSGFASLTKTGAGTASLYGSQTYQGGTSVVEGSLRVEDGASIVGTTLVGGGRLLVDGTAEDITVFSGGTLGGIGTVGATRILSGGTLAPGNSIGTLTVAGDLTLDADAIYAVEVSPAAADRTNVTGTATLTGATVATTFQPGTYVDKEYLILNAAGGLNGTTFGALTGTVPRFFAQSLRYDANNVYLVIDSIYAPLSGFNANQQQVADAINAYFNANDGVPGAFVGLTSEQLTQLGGPVATASVGAGMHAAGQFLDAMGGADAGNSASAGDTSTAYAPLAYSAEPANLSSPGALAALGAEVPASSDAANAVLAMSSAHAADPVDVAMAKRWGMWGTVYGSVGRIGGDPVVGSADLTARNWGIASGFERSFGGTRLGLSLGGAGSTFSLANGLGSGSAGIFNAGIYGSHSFGNAYVSGALGYGWNNVRTTRNVPGDTLTANFNAHTLAGRLETGYRFGSTSAVTPYVALQGGNYFLPAYTETSALNGPFALAYGRQSEAFLRSELGARFEHSMPTSTGSLKFSARAAWAYNAINDRAVTAAFAALPGQTFTVNGARPARSAALLDLGVEASFDSGLSAKLNFSGEFSRNVSAYGASAKLIYRW